MYANHVELMSNESCRTYVKRSLSWANPLTLCIHRWTWSTKLPHVQICLNCVELGVAMSTMYRQSYSRLLLEQVLLEKESRCCRAVPDGAPTCRAASHGASALPRRSPWRVSLDAPSSVARQKLVQSRSKWGTKSHRFFLTKNIFYKNKAYTTWRGLQEYIFTYIFSYIM